MRKLTHNLPFKLLSLLLAVFVWYLAEQGAQPEERNFFVPLVFTNFPPNMQITSDVPPRVNISGRIRRRDLRSFDPSEAQAVIDLSNVTAGTFQYTLTDQNISVPKEFSIVRINPSQIELVIEEVVEKEMSIIARYQGQLKKGNILQRIEIVPNVVRLRGAKSLIDPIDSIFTTEINLQDLDQSIELSVGLDIPNKSLEPMNKHVESYKAQITVSSLPIKKVFNDVQVQLMNQKYVTRINPKSITMYLEGPEELLNKMDSSQIFGSVDLTQYPPGSYWVIPEPIIPENITLLQQWPQVSLWVKPQKLSFDQNPKPSPSESSVTTPSRPVEKVQL